MSNTTQTVRLLSAAVRPNAVNDVDYGIIFAGLSYGKRRDDLLHLPQSAKSCANLWINTNLASSFQAYQLSLTAMDLWQPQSLVIE